MRHRHPWVLLALALALVVPLLGPAGPTHAESSVTLTVNTLADEWSTDANAAKSKCSLREALQATITNSPPGNQGCGPVGTGNFSSYIIALMPGTYTLTRQEDLPSITKKIRIDGNNSVKVDGNRDAGRFHGIFIVGGGELILEQVKLQNGRRSAGGALWVKSGKAQLSEVEFYRNIAFSSATVGDGGAIIIDTGELSCLKCRFIENKAAGNGGAVRTGNTKVLLDKSEFLRNEAQFYGGAIAGFGGSEVTRPRIVGSLFRENKVYRTNVPANWPGSYAYTDDTSGGGTIYNSGNMVIEQSQFVKSTTERSKGGGTIYNQGDLTLLEVAISGGEAIAGGPVPATIGGAILNQGRLNALRVSIHANQATRGGGIMNAQGGTLYLVNSTVAKNIATAAAGLSNGFNFTVPGTSTVFSNSGGDAYVFLSTLVRNDDGESLGNVVDYGAPGTVYMGNTVTDAGCTGTIYTYGGNTFVGLNPCQTFAPDGGSDHGALTSGSLKLEGLDDNGGVSLPEAGFLSVKLKSDSPAVDLGRAKYCTGLDAALLGALDQIRTQRPQGNLCDAGALEAGVSPPEWAANPTEDEPLIFPVIFASQASAGDRTITIGNKGGGSIKWEAKLTRNDGGVFSILTSPPSGDLGKGDEETFALRCTPIADETYYGALTFSIDQPEERDIVYNLVCSRRADADDPVATPHEPPAPVSGGQAPQGGQVQTQIKITNQGTKAMPANLSWANAGVSALSVSPLGAVSVLAGAVLTINVTCAPTGPGLFSNTLSITTGDPVQPTLSYPISCEGAPNPDPNPLEKTNPSQEAVPEPIMGLALSPENTQVLAGHWNDEGVARYARGADGALTYQGLFQVAGMGGVTGIRYSRDGKNVYYSSNLGDGVVAATRGAGGSLTWTQTITRSTTYLCGLLKFCPVGTMLGARALDISPDDKNLYVSGYSDGSLTVLWRNPADGTLLFTQSFTGTIEGVSLFSGAFGVLVSRDGKNVYLASQVSDAVVAFSRRPDNGRLRYLGHQILSPVGTAGGPTELAISPDGRFLYVASTSSDSVHILARNPNDGSLTPLQTVPVGVDPYHILISHDPDGARLMVALWNGNAIKVYKRDRETGAIAPLAGQADLLTTGPVFLVGTPDDRDVYAALFEGMGVQHLRMLRTKPVALSVAPASVAAGAGAQTLTVRGQGFAPDSRVYWQGAPLTTTYVSATRLDAAVPANLVAGAGTASVFVRTPPAGGGDSAALTVAIQAAGTPPIPSVSGISPEAAPADEPLTITVSGAGFTTQSRVLLNGAPLPTTYLNAGKLLATLGPDEVGAAGPLAITVVNGAVGAAALGEPAALDPSLLELSEAAAEPAAPAGTPAPEEPVIIDLPAGPGADEGPVEPAAVTASAPARFAVAAPGEPATPAISGFSPASLTAGSAGQWVTVRGLNFSRRQGASTTALWGGAPRETIVLDATTLQLRVSTADLAAAGTPVVTLFTPGAGVSEGRGFPILAAGSNPVAIPEVAAVEPGSPLRIVVSGEGFVSGAQIRLNGVALATTYVSKSVLSAPITLAQLRRGGIVRVANPGTALSAELLLAPQRMLWLPVVRR